MKIEISILTVSYNSARFLTDYFESIIKSNFFKNGKVEIILYDGGSNDDSVKIINEYKKIYNNISIFCGDNIGFAGANNLLADRARGEFLFILNPDVKLEINCLNALTNNAHKNNGIIVPMQRLFDGSFLSHGTGMDIFGYPCRANKKFFYADGAAIFIKKDIFDKLGKFDTDYFMFQEDVDLSWRAHLMAIPLYRDDEVIVYHYSGGSIEGGAIKDGKLKTNYFRRYLGERNILTNLLKNYSLPNLIWVLPTSLIINFFEIFLYLLLFKPKVSFCYIKAYWWNIKNLHKILQKRKLIQTQRIKSDADLLKKMYWSSSKFKILLEIGIPKFS